MLVTELETAFEFVSREALVSPDLATNYREVEEVGRGSFGFAQQLDREGVGSVDEPLSRGRPEELRRAEKRDSSSD